MFDRERFLSTHFIAREAVVLVPELAEFFGPGESPGWKVRGLTGPELGRVNEAVARNQQIAAYLDGLASGLPAAITAAVSAHIGRDITPAEVAKRVEQLVLGSIDPAVDIELAVKICTAFPVQVWELTNKILQLTGQGHVPGKPTPSGTTPESGPA